MYFDENDDSQFSQTENGTSALHQILLEQKEKLAKNARRKKRKLRQNWYKFYLFLRQQRIAQFESKLNQSKNRKIEQICDIAANFVVENFSLDPIVGKVSSKTQDFFKPLENVEAQNARIPKQEDLVASIASVFAYHLDFSKTANPIARNVGKVVRNFSDFELITKPPLDLDEIDPDIPRRAVENMNIVCAPIDSRKEAEGIFNFTQDNLLFNEVSSMEAIANVAANIAVANVGFEHECLPQFGGTVLPQLRPFLRVAFPRWDNEVELTLDRGDTLDPDSITTWFNEKTPEIKEPKYLSEAREMLGDTDEMVKDFADRILPNQMKDILFKAIGLEDVLDEYPIQPAVLVSTDPDQSVRHSMTFIDEEMRVGLVKFCADHIGVYEAAEKIKGIGGDLYKQNIKRQVAQLTFDTLGALTPFLKGAADVKRHKLEGGNDAASLTRRWKDEMMNKIRAFLD